MKIKDFQKTIYDHYSTHKREFPWRETTDPYAILVSEVMLQQTQTGRSIPKYQEFLTAFPTVQRLASASIQEVLIQWQGLGYNRRGVYLRHAARIIRDEYDGIVPRDIAQLDSLPGIGYATACAIVAYAHNIPTVFIETNIRTVFLYHFFNGKENVTDSEIMPLVVDYIDRDNPRDWYYALMDYGVHLKKEKKFVNSQSKHYAIQSKFAGSVRQVRGEVVRQLAKSHSVNIDSFLSDGIDPVKLRDALEGLEKDELIVRDGASVKLKD